MAMTCPNCGGFDISPETDRFHCLDCGNYFTYDNAEASAGPAPEPLFVPEERVAEVQENPEPTDHAALAAAQATGTEGIDAQVQSSAEQTPPAPSADPTHTTAQPGGEAAPAETNPGTENADQTAREGDSGEAVSQPTQEPA